VPLTLAYALRRFVCESRACRGDCDCDCDRDDGKGHRAFPEDNDVMQDSGSRVPRLLPGSRSDRQHRRHIVCRVHGGQATAIPPPAPPPPLSLVTLTMAVAPWHCVHRVRRRRRRRRHHHRHHLRYLPGSSGRVRGGKNPEERG